MKIDSVHLRNTNINLARRLGVILILLTFTMMVMTRKKPCVMTTRIIQKRLRLEENYNISLFSNFGNNFNTNYAWNKDKNRQWD